MQTAAALTKIKDSTLLDQVLNLVRREKEIVVEVIAYLREIELRKLHLARGYSSMFAFATDFLGYSEAEAHIRIQAARLSQVLPEVCDKIQSGELSLSVAATAQAHLRKENLRRKEEGRPLLNVQERREVLNLVTGSSSREAERNLNIHFAQPSKKVLTFAVSPELEQKIEKLMDFMAHKNFDRDLSQVLDLLVSQELKKFEKQVSLRSEATKDIPKADKCNLPSANRKRYISTRTKSLVWAKYRGKCTYRDPLTGKSCDSTHGIQFDHRRPIARGGLTSFENLTLLCASHNSWKGQRQVE